MKEKLLSYTAANASEKHRLDTFLSEGEKPSEVHYSTVQKVVWLNKNPKDWCPSPYQIHNLYGRCVLTALLFCIPAYFPPKIDLAKFGYNLEGDNLSFNLTSTLGKEKNVRMLLTGLINKGAKVREENISGKRTLSNVSTKNQTKKKAKKDKPKQPTNLID